MEIGFSILAPIRSGPEIHSVAGMTHILLSLAIAALVVFILVRRFGTRKVGSEARMFVLPLAMAVIAVVQGDLVDGHQVLLSESLLAAGILLALGLGAGLGYTMRLWRDETGTRWSRGTGLTVVLLLATILVRAGLVAAGLALGLAVSVGAMIMFVAAWLLAHNAVIAWRVRTLPAPAVSVSP